MAFSPNSSNVAASIPLFKQRTLISRWILKHSSQNGVFVFPPLLAWVTCHHLSPHWFSAQHLLRKKTGLGRWAWMAWGGDWESLYWEWWEAAVTDETSLSLSAWKGSSEISLLLYPRSPTVDPLFVSLPKMNDDLRSSTSHNSSSIRSPSHHS